MNARKWKRYLQPWEMDTLRQWLRNNACDPKLYGCLKWHLFSSDPGLLTREDWQRADHRLGIGLKQLHQRQISVAEFKDFYNEPLIQLLELLLKREKQRKPLLDEEAFILARKEGEPVPEPTTTRKESRLAAAARPAQPRQLGFGLHKETKPIAPA